MTRVAWELPCFQPLQTRGSDAGCRQPSPPCGRVGQVCRVCVCVQCVQCLQCVPCVPRVPAYRVCQRGSGWPSTGRDWLSSLPLRLTRFQSQHIIRAPPAAQQARGTSGQSAARGVQALAGRRRALPLSSHPGKRSGSIRWQQQQPQQEEGGSPGETWAGAQEAHGAAEVPGRGIWQSQAGTGTGCWAACCHWMQEMWGALALASCGFSHPGVPPSDAGRPAVTRRGRSPGWPPARKALCGKQAVGLLSCASWPQRPASRKDHFPTTGSGGITQGFSPMWAVAPPRLALTGGVFVSDAPVLSPRLARQGSKIWACRLGNFWQEAAWPGLLSASDIGIVCQHLGKMLEPTAWREFWGMPLAFVSCTSKQI